MIKTRGLLLGVMMAAAVLVGSAEVRAQAEGPQASLDSSVDGRSGAVLQAGAYEVYALVGQPVAGRIASRSGGIWLLQHRARSLEAGVSLHQALEVPTVYALEANYPNPFNAATTIRYALPEASRVRLVVYDLLGRVVARLVDKEEAAGRYAVVFEGRALASGLYVYRMTAGEFEHHKTMMLIK